MKRNVAIEIKKLYEDLSPLIEAFTSEACPSCRDVCCKQKHAHLEEKDKTFLSALGETYIEPSSARGPEEPCEFLSENGCSKPRWQRPFRCTWYFCETLLEYMPERNPKSLRRLQLLIQELQRKRESL